LTCQHQHENGYCKCTSDSNDSCGAIDCEKGYSCQFGKCFPDGGGCGDCKEKCPGASRTDCINDQCECYYDEKEESEWILETSYYSRYFIVYSLFMKVGIKSEIHECTIFALKSIFNELGIVKSELCKDLENSRDLRVDALYYDKDFGKEEILNKANTAPEFCLEVESIVDSISKEDVLRIRNKLEEIRGR